MNPPPTGGRTPRAGEIVLVDRRASVQFRTPIYFRVIRVHDWPTYDGWVWLDGYQLNAAGDAVDRRSIFVQVGGLQQVQITVARPADRRQSPSRRPTQRPDRTRTPV